MREIDLGISLELTEEEKYNLLLIYLDTVPYIDVIEDIEMFLAGYSNELSERTKEVFKRDESRIPNLVNLIRGDDDAY